MPTSVDRRDLEAIPDESMIADFREEAADQDASIEASFPASDGDTKRLVVSPRGTVVLLKNVSEETFNRSVAPAEIADALRS
jgi:hypothetical protein